MSYTEIVGLVLAAAAGGAINAVAGGGTLLTFPTLLLFGTPPIVANATSTLALVLGTSGSLYGYRQHLAAVKPWLWRFLPISLLGGAIGGALLIYTSNRVFAKLVPFLIFFATVLFLAQGIFRRFAAARTVAAATGRGGNGDQKRPTIPPLPRREGRGEEELRHRYNENRVHHSAAASSAVWGAVLFQFGVAIYGGYFGAGIGILMLASLGFIGLSHIHEMNTLKTVLGSLINLVAAVVFIFAGLVNWHRAGLMTVGAIGGYYLGAHYAQRIPQRRVRQIITAVGFILSVVTFYQEFVR